MPKVDLFSGAAKIEGWTERTFALIRPQYPYERWCPADKARGRQSMRTILSAYVLQQSPIECAQRLATWVRVEKAKLSKEDRLPAWGLMKPVERQSFLQLATAGYRVLANEEGYQDGPAEETSDSGQ